jgi:hypothetical protein
MSRLLPKQKPTWEEDELSADAVRANLSLTASMIDFATSYLLADWATDISQHRL